MKKIFLLFVVGLFIPSHCYAQSQASFTFRAPSPVGHYETLTLVPQNNAPVACNTNTLWITYRQKESSGNGSRLYLCTPSGWQIMDPWVQDEDTNRIVLSEPDDTKYSTLTLGIGIDRTLNYTAPFKLTLDGDGGIIARGALGGGAPVPYGPNTFLGDGTGTTFMWHPKKAALRALHIDGTGYGAGKELNPIYIGDYSVAFGKNTGAIEQGTTVSGGEKNLAWGAHSTIGGGYDNVAGLETVFSSMFGTPLDTYSYATIGGGRENRANNEGVTIGGGVRNQTQSKYATIGGGEGNRIWLAVSGWSTVGGGKNNSAGSSDLWAWDAGAMATVAGGGENMALGFGSTISGGYHNWIDPTSGFTTGSSVGGGGYNQVNGGMLGVIGGGWNNRIGTAANYAVIGGGGGDNVNTGNEANAEWTTIGGGTSNKANAIKSTIAGGQLHTTKANFAFIGGGTNNTVGDDLGNGIYGSILGGRNNVVEGASAVVAGGAENAANGNYAITLGGYQLTAHGDYSLAAGRGMQLDANANNTFVWGHNSSGTTTINTPDAFIIATGNVGIGTTTPTHKLHIKDVMKLEPREDAPACDAAEDAGVMYIKSDTSDLCLCQGPGTWANITNPGSPDLCF